MEADRVRLQCFLLRARTQYSRKKGQESVFGLVCATVSPSSVQFQPLLQFASFLATYFSVGWVFAYIWPGRKSWKWILWEATSAFHCQPDSGNIGTILWMWYAFLFPLSLVLCTLNGIYLGEALLLVMLGQTAMATWLTSFEWEVQNKSRTVWPYLHTKFTRKLKEYLLIIGIKAVICLCLNIYVCPVSCVSLCWALLHRE